MSLTTAGAAMPGSTLKAMRRSLKAMRRSLKAMRKSLKAMRRSLKHAVRSVQHISMHYYSMIPPVGIQKF